MIKYQRPSEVAFQSRREFHSCQRMYNESANEWLQRIKYSIETCEYGILNEVMFTDKFLSGLDNDDFAKLSQLATWSEEQFRHHLSENQVVDHGNLKSEFVDSAIGVPQAMDFVIKEEPPIDHIEFHFANVEENEIKSEPIANIEEGLDLLQENESTQTAHSKKGNKMNRSAPEQKPVSKKGWRKTRDPSLYICKVCNVNCFYPSKFKRHMESSLHRDNLYMNKTFECHLCGATYGQFKFFNSHFNKKHVTPKLNCLVCDEIFLDQKSLNQHMKTHDKFSEQSNSKQVVSKDFIVNKSDGSVLCLKCQKLFKQKELYNTHRRTEHPDQIRISQMHKISYNCVICNQKFTEEAQLKLHIKAANHHNASFECYLCSNKYNQLLSLKLHFAHLHKPQKKRNFKCSFCRRTFLKRNEFEYHVNVHRGLIAGHKCPHCDKVWDTKQNLKIHLSMHETGKFICETCGRSYKSDKHLKQHFRVHNNKKSFKCTECDQELCSAIKFEHHMRLHTGERPYICDLCGKTFVSPASLRHHLQVHTGVKKHACTLCEKKFFTSSALSRHKNSHTGAKLHPCNLCDRSYSQRSTLRQHLLKIHNTILKAKIGRERIQ